jgi:hypothetical protein
VPGTDEADHVKRRLYFVPERTQIADERPSPGICLKATNIPATAYRPSFAAIWHVPQVTSSPLRATIQFVIGNDTATDARAHLDQKHIMVLRPAGSLLAERHSIDVVIYQCWTIIPLSKVTRNVELIPAGHNRRADDAASCELHRTWYRNADPAYILRQASGRYQERFKRLCHSIEDRVRPGCYIQRTCLLTKDSTRQVSNRTAQVTRAYIGDEQDPP